MQRDYSKPEYWESRYKNDNGIFDWYVDWDEYFEENIMQLGIKSPVLVVGCGNSDLSEKMEAKGITPVVSIDISHSCVKNMKKIFKNGCYLPMDVCDMQFRDNVFPCVIDKGTLDALLCARDYEVNVTKMMTEIARVLMPGGMFLEMTFGKTGERLGVLEDKEILPWNLERIIEINSENTGETNIFIFRKLLDNPIINPDGKLLYLYEDRYDDSDSIDQ